MKEYFRILKKNRLAALGMVLLVILSAAADVAAGYSLGWILDSYEAESERIRALLFSSLACFALFLLTIVMDYIREIALFRMERRFKNDLREMISRKFSGLSCEQMLDRDSGAYVSWLSNDTDALYEKSFKALFSGIQYAFTAGFAFTVMTASCWYLGAVSILLFALGVALPQLFSKQLERAAAKRSAALESSMEAYKDAIMGAGILTLSGLRHRIVERICAVSDCAEREIFLSNRSTRRATIIMHIQSLASQCILLATAVYAAIRGAVPLGVALSVGNLCGQFFNGIQQLMNSVMSIRSTKPLWEKFMPEEAEEENKIPLSSIGTIAFENVSFSYGERAVLQGDSFSFRTDGKYAIVGESGSGKTTLLKLILGLLPEYKGNILYDGTEQRSASLSTLYGQIAYVDQQVYLFQDTLRFNITLGQPYSDAEILSAIHAARLEEFVESLPDGLDSIIRENGKNLSGGQRQRIALARGLIRRARLILLDEGTSALDTENAAEIEQSLLENASGVIFITHHLRDGIRNQLTGVYEL